MEKLADRCEAGKKLDSTSAQEAVAFCRDFVWVALLAWGLTFAGLASHLINWSKPGEMLRAQPDHEDGREEKPQPGEVAGRR